MGVYTWCVTGDQREERRQMLARGLADTTRRIRDGEAARTERDKLIQAANDDEWTQEEIAEAAGISQQAVSKRLMYLARRKATTE
jgi:response regulator of citrate/malate metabolism